MGQWLFVISALNELGVPVTLRFSDAGYIDGSNNFYEPRIISPALVTVTPSDGGVFNMFGQPSIGDIELANQDGGIDFFAGYAVDGREAELFFVDGLGVSSLYFSGTVGKLSERGGSILVALKSRQEALGDAHPMAVYVGTNALPMGLEGTEDDADKIKPKVFGLCKNVSAPLVNESLIIHQASSRADCRIIAVYDEGVRLVNFKTNGAALIGDTVIAVDSGLGAIPAGAEIVFGNHLTIYTVLAGAVAGGSLTLTTGLVANVPDNSPVEHINFYANTADMQLTDYATNAERFISDKSIAVAGGSGGIAAGDKVMFANHPAIYTVATGLSAGSVVLSTKLIEDVPENTYLRVVGSGTPALWGSYGGYFRLGLDPLGLVTCDAISIDGSKTVHKTGDVLSLLADEAGITIDAASVAEINAVGTAGLYVDAETPTRELFDRIIRGVGGYYHFINDVLYANLLRAPTVSAAFTIDDSQIKSITRNALGMGKNGVPFKSILVKYNRIETTQTAFAGYVPAWRRERLKNQYLEKKQTDATAQARHSLAESLVIESLLSAVGSAGALIDRLMPIVSVRRDTVDVEAHFSQIPVFAIGDTIKIITPRLGYNNGRRMVIVGYTLDAKKELLTLRVFG